MHPYRATPGINAALEEIARYKGIRFDRDAVDAFFALFSGDEFEYK